MTGLWDIALSLASEPWLVGIIAVLVFVAGGLFGALIIAVVTISATAEEWHAGWKAGYRDCLRKYKIYAPRERNSMVSMYLEIKKIAEEGLDASTKEGQRAALKSILEHVNAVLDIQKDWRRKNV